MIIEPFEFEMKDGRTALIRSPNYGDVPGLIEYLRVSAGETEFLIRYPEECGKYTEAAERAFVDRVNASGSEAMLTAIVEGRVVGTCQVLWSGSIKTRHRAQVAIAILRDCWGQGLGRRLMLELIRIAEENEDIIQMELDFVEGNSRARALYESLGFRITGVKPNAIRLKDGTLLNEYSMVKVLRPGAGTGER